MLENEYSVGKCKYKMAKPLKEGDVVVVRYGIFEGLYTNNCLSDYFSVESDDTIKRRISANPLESPDIVQTLTGEDINKANLIRKLKFTLGKVERRTVYRPDNKKSSIEGQER